MITENSLRVLCSSFVLQIYPLGMYKLLNFQVICNKSFLCGDATNLYMVRITCLTFALDF